MTPLRVAVVGAAGRMGRAILRLLVEDRRFSLVAAIVAPDDSAIGLDAGVLAGAGAMNVPVGCDPPEQCDVVLEFSSPDGCGAWAQWCGARAAALVSGTTGLQPHHREALSAAAATAPVVWSANMSVGVNVLLALVESAASRLTPGWDVEIVEAHHRRKVDAPSGTAGLLRDAVFAGRGEVLRERPGRAGVVGPRAADEIGLHAVRLGGVIGDHDVLFASENEVVSLSHRALSRDVFASGALRAAAWAAGRPPGLYDMRDVLGLRA